jgi:predicted glycogen debranching enzyme
VLQREWLLTNGLGGYASGTVIGCPTRRYHGLLVASRRPPLERVVLLANTLDQVVVDGETFETPTFAFRDATHPNGHVWLTHFDFSLDPAAPWAEFVFDFGPAKLRKRITMADGRDVVRIGYEVMADSRREVQVNVMPLLAGRDFHSLVQFPSEDRWDLRGEYGLVWAKDRHEPEITVALLGRRTDSRAALQFEPNGIWWHNFHYRAEQERGQDDIENLFALGWYRAEGRGNLGVEVLVAGLADEPAEAEEMIAAAEGVLSAPPGESFSRLDVATQLSQSANQFVVRRRSPAQPASTTILAGYPWFGDWGRDAFIALPGLLLTTKRFKEAKQVLTTFAGVQRNGLIPNRFNDYGGPCDYNSVDASLWFIHAADTYVRATGDKRVWEAVLEPACRGVIDAYEGGTDFDIMMDSDGLVRCGNRETQITWMDAKCGGTVFTPRHGKPVEINTLWYHGLKCLAERAAKESPQLSKRYDVLAHRVESAFEKTFFNRATGGLHDCIRPDEVDASIRPNQIFAVSLPHSPLSIAKQRGVVDCVREHLLTPMGLRSLSPEDPQYHPAYMGNAYERDGAYHQGTVWGWLMGPFVEAYLRTNEFSPESKRTAAALLAPMIDHLSEAGLGSINEIFDGDAPHAPRGCIAQAWSVGEVLRVYDLLHADVGSVDVAGLAVT